MTEPKRHVFVSYARADTERVAPIIAALREEGLDVWLDQEDIAGAAFWRKEIVEAIAECSVVVFFATRLSCNSESVSKELALANEENKPILPILLDDVEPSAEVRYQIAGLQHVAWFSNPALGRRQASAALQRYASQPKPALTSPRNQNVAAPRSSFWLKATSVVVFSVVAVAIFSVAIANSRTHKPDPRPAAAEKVPPKPAPSPVTQPPAPATATPPLPNLPTVWLIETTTTATDYSPYLGLRVRYRVLLTQNGSTLDVRGEKIGEVNKGQLNELTGRGKTPIHLAGSLQPQSGGKPTVKLSGEEGSTQRGNFPTAFDLRVDSTNQLAGRFNSTAANASGSAIWMSEALWRTNGWPAP